jgi:hypothetical protein
MHCDTRRHHQSISDYRDLVGNLIMVSVSDGVHFARPPTAGIEGACCINGQLPRVFYFGIDFDRKTWRHRQFVQG